ncbi:hypothetical protein GCM10014719_70630 [Planomonospora parontospora subsp. antibiotica]|nr:hypothetical protein GCM10014719_70630 [Planomonospora parontospora subsp. antibiotica]GII20291.1 hypothetical protein Ppa05_70170 [Planomonospora parontospora subsp. antibiotica]
MAACRERRGIVVGKTGDHMLPVLSSMGVAKGERGTLTDALTGSKKAYDEEKRAPYPVVSGSPGARPASRASKAAWTRLAQRSLVRMRLT